MAINSSDGSKTEKDGQSDPPKRYSARERLFRDPLDWLRHVLYDRVLPNYRSFRSERQLLVWGIALAIGIASAYLSIVFRKLIGLFQYPWLGTTSESVFEQAALLPWWVVLLAPTLGGLAVGLFLQFVMPGKRAYGVADVIEARALLGCRVPAHVGLSSALVSSFSLGVGASAGREGPVVHLGASIASVLEDLFKLPHSARRTLLACGVAAAVSASFNAPIAGVLFAHEVILAHFAQRAFVPIVISSVSAALISRVHLGSFPAFIIPNYQITSYWEFPAFALLGLTCAAVAIAFQFALIATDKSARAIDIPLWLRPVIGGLMIGTMGIWFPQVLGVGYDATDAALKHLFPLWLMLTLIVLKAAATAITLASRFGGGVFSPSLYLGAMAGGSFGLIAAGAFPEAASSEGLYAILGMGAVAAAVLGAPISTAMIVFELTGGYDMTIALLLAVSISSGLTQAVHGQSFFHWQLSTRGIFVQEGPHKHIVRSLCVREFMLPLDPDEDDRLVETPDEETSWLTLDDTVESALQAFDRTGEFRLPVVDGADTAKVVGWVEHLDALSAYNKALIEASEEEHR